MTLILTALPLCHIALSARKKAGERSRVALIATRIPNSRKTAWGCPPNIHNTSKVIYFCAESHIVQGNKSAEEQEIVQEHVLRYRAPRWASKSWLVENSSPQILKDIFAGQYSVNTLLPIQKCVQWQFQLEMSWPLLLRVIQLLIRSHHNPRRLT